MQRFLNFCAKYGRIISWCLLVLAILFPLAVKSAYLIRLGITCLMYAAVAMSLNLVIGNLGQMSMGHAAFWGIGAYTAAILSTKFSVDSVATVLSAIVVVGIFSLLLGIPVLKLKGYYLTVVTLGFCEIIRLVELNWSSLTRGALGISRIPAFRFFGITLKDKTAVFYIALVMLLFTIWVMRTLIQSKQGLAIMAIRDDEIAAASVGINVFFHKMLAFTVSGMIAGMMGAFYAHYASYIDSTLFTTGQSMNFAIFAIFGGLGSIPGAIGGTIALTVLPETLRFLDAYRTFLYGVIIVIIMLVKPDGILGKVNFTYIAQRLNMEKEDRQQNESEGQ